MYRYEVVIAPSDSSRCKILFASNSKDKCKEVAEGDIKKWLHSYGLDNMHLWILDEGTPVEDIFL